MSETTNSNANPKKEFVKATRSQKKGSKEILRLGQKVYDYRKDLLSEEDAESLESANNGLQKALAKKPLSGPQLEEKAKEVDVQLQKSGDLYYHKKFFIIPTNSWVENVEMLLVAAIVVIGIRNLIWMNFFFSLLIFSYYSNQLHVPVVFRDELSVRSGKTTSCL